MMHLHRLLPLILALCAAGPTLAQFNDDFTDGNFSEAPAWNGDAGLFTLVDNGGNFQLRSNSAGAATYHLSTPSAQAVDAQWEFFIDLRFATSGANLVDVYLISPQADLNVRPPGYFVRIGDTPDHIALYKRVGTTNTALVQSANSVVGSSSSNPFRIRVTRALDDTWTLAYQQGGSGPYTTVGTAVDNTFSTSSHFGIVIVQSTAASPVNNHFFDDFSVGPIPVDLSPPEILSVDVTGPQTVGVIFSEPVSEATANDPGHYSLQPGIAIAAAQRETADPARVNLTLASNLQNGTTYTLTVNGVEDLVGNATVDAQANFLYFVPDVPGFRDVVINELMSDPNPPVGLPDAEYIELFNATTDKFFDLASWRIMAGTSSATLPNYALGPGEYVVFVSATNHPLFSFVPNSRPYSLSTTGLVNAGSTVTLEAPGGITIDALTYNLDWYRDGAKDDGGWSLEQINPFAPCSGAFNWRASNATAGGTPGLPNSVLNPTPDTDAPALQRILNLSPNAIELVFSEGMNGTSVANGSYTVEPPLPITQIAGLAPTNQRVQVLFSQELEPGILYRLTVTGVADCSGNPIGSANTALFAIPDTAMPGDIVINEVLPNPITTGGEYVELYNRSNKVIGLQGWQMANESSGTVANPRTITTEQVLILPGEYLLLTRNPAVTQTQFPLGRSDRFLTVDLPSYTNTSGTVVVLDGQANVIDLFRYNEELHLRLLRDVKGVSLERQDPDRPTEDPTNWHSAAAVVGYGTPGYRNSQFAPAPEPLGELTVEPAIFSPDNDGFQDVVTITYRFNSPGAVGTLGVFDVAGREVRRLLDNQILGVTGSVSWDGVLDSGGKGRIGPYVLVMEVFDLSGNVERFRHTVTLAHRLD